VNTQHKTKGHTQIIYDMGVKINSPYRLKTASRAMRKCQKENHQIMGIFVIGHVILVGETKLVF
jgi:hypothetical protein